MSRAIIDYIHRVNNKIVKPLNANFDADFSFGIYTDDNSFNFLPNATIENDSLILVGEDMQIIKNWIADNRIFEGIPYTLQFTSTGEMIYDIGESCLDLTDAKFEQEPDRITLKIVDKRIMFSQQADALNLRLLLKQKIFSKSDYEPINYVYKAVPDYLQSFMLSTTLFQLIKETLQSIKDIAKDIANVIPLGVGTVQALIQAVYISAMIVQIQQLVEQIPETLFQRVRFYYAIKIKTLLIKACAYFGYSFESSILDRKDFLDSCLITPKSERGVLLGKQSNDDGVPNQTLKEVFTLITSLFNAKLKIDGNVIRMERWDYFIQNSNPKVVLKNIRDEDFKDIPKGNNASQLKANITFTFSKDDSDYTTYQKRKGFSAQIHSKLKNVLNPKFTFLKGVKQINPNATRASRKDSQGSLEKILATIIDAYEVFTGGSTSLKGKRIGCLELPQDAFGIAKIAKIKDGFLTADNDTIINASYLIKEFYEIDSVANNQQKTLSKEIEHPFTIKEVLELRKSGVALLPNGQKCLVEKLKFIQEKGLYLITVRWFENYCNNVETVFTES